MNCVVLSTETTYGNILDYPALSRDRNDEEKIFYFSSSLRPLK